ncbi:TPA: hypothetical protein N0F65_005644 [Lagenidium giganteum]|uniref:Uncharacterized protein n=1 Tax=Lagenidium giganteum TaxID=4803 RepID=A0AAV2YWG7_9STRA|nr:TPA: hypothetical protein N0F65_005644 [Lagenidium giganteum]
MVMAASEDRTQIDLVHTTSDIGAGYDIVPPPQNSGRDYVQRRIELWDGSDVKAMELGAVYSLPLPLQVAFRQKMLSIFALQLLLVTVLVGVLEHKQPLPTKLAEMVHNKWVVLGPFALVVVFLVLLYFVRNRFPLNWLVLLLFSGTQSLFFASLGVAFHTNIGIFNCAFTFACILLMTILSRVRRRKHDQDEGMLLSSFAAGMAAFFTCAVIAGGLYIKYGRSFIKVEAFAYSLLFQFVLLTWFSVDASAMYSIMSPDEYMHGVIYFYTDMVLLFMVCVIAAAAVALFSAFSAACEGCGCGDCGGDCCGGCCGDCGGGCCWCCHGSTSHGSSEGKCCCCVDCNGRSDNSWFCDINCHCCDSCGNREHEASYYTRWIDYWTDDHDAKARIPFAVCTATVKAQRKFRFRLFAIFALQLLLVSAMVALLTHVPHSSALYKMQQWTVKQSIAKESLWFWIAGILLLLLYVVRHNRVWSVIVTLLFTFAEGFVFANIGVVLHTNVAVFNCIFTFGSVFMMALLSTVPLRANRQLPRRLLPPLLVGFLAFVVSGLAAGVLFVQFGRSFVTDTAFGASLALQFVLIMWLAYDASIMLKITPPGGDYALGVIYFNTDTVLAVILAIPALVMWCWVSFKDSHSCTHCVCGQAERCANCICCIAEPVPMPVGLQPSAEDSLIWLKDAESSPVSKDVDNGVVDTLHMQPTTQVMYRV